MKKLQQFKVYSFSEDFLRANNYEITITPLQAEMNEQLISLADSECLRAIRRITGHGYSDELLEELLKDRKRTVKKPNSAENKRHIADLNNQIRDLLFIPQFISVQTEKKGHYKKIGCKGFYVNGVHYVRFMCGAGHARTNRAMFLDERIFKELSFLLRCGCDEKISIVPAKWNAYFSLSSSATYKVTTPRFCVIPDYEVEMLKTVDWVTEEEYEDVIETCEKNLKFNIWDGMGIISPDFAQQWASDIGLEYLPSGFICRAPFTKGMVAVFDFKKFAREVAGKNIIKDIYGKEFDCMDLDLILTESQFKLAGGYKSTEEFSKNMADRGLSWGVSKFSPKEEDNVKFSNYQFLQVLKCNDDDIKELCQPTIEWFHDIFGENYEAMVLYLIGKLANRCSGVELFNRLGDPFVQALLINPELSNDSYIKERILNSLKKRIRESYMGKLILNGNFQFMVMDPYAFCEHAFGMKVKGILGENQHYSGYWNGRGVNQICAMRSPLTWRSEVNLLNLINTPKANEWFKYLNSGIILNIYGYDCMLFAGADFDGDIVFTTDNPVFLRCRYGGLPVAYQPKKAEKKIIKPKTLYKTDVLGFGTNIGFITNCSTALYEKQTLYDKGSKNYETINNWLKLCCKYQSHEIDHAKGIQTKPFPKHITTYEKILEDDSPEVIDRKELSNILCIDGKRPYFMRYLYPKYDKEYKELKKDAELYSELMFGDVPEKLSEEVKATEEFQEFWKYYALKNPLLETNGTMNRICYHMEKSLKDLKLKSSKTSDDEIFDILFDNSLPVNKVNLGRIEDVYNKYIQFKREKLISNSSFTTYEQFYRSLRDESLEKISSNLCELSNLAVKFCYDNDKKVQKNFAWDVFGSGIVDNLIRNNNVDDKNIVKIPMKSTFGSQKYLGNDFLWIDCNINPNSNDKIDNNEFNFDDLDDFDSLFEGFEE